MLIRWQLEQLVPDLAQYLLDHGVQLNHHDEKNVLLEFKTDQHFVFPEGGGNAIIQNRFKHISHHRLAKQGMNILARYPL